MITPGSYRQLFLKALAALEPVASPEDKEAIKHYNKILQDENYKLVNTAQSQGLQQQYYSSGELFFRS